MNVNSGSAEACVIRPWEAGPYKLVSWGSIMEQFQVGTFCDLMSELDQVIDKFQIAFDERDKWQLDEGEEKKLDWLLDRVKEHATTLGLTLSIRKIERMTIFRGVAALFAERGGIGGYASRHAVQGELKDLKERIDDETRSVLFFFVKPDSTNYYNDALARFGKETTNAFPGAMNDITEAGKCIALSRSTAAVFHLMRVAERGLRAIAKKYDVADKFTWNAYIVAINNKLKQNKVSGRQPEDQILEQLVTQIDFMRVAFRNPVMHVTGTFTEEHAIEIFNHVKAFMRVLAGVAKEPFPPEVVKRWLESMKAKSSAEYDQDQPE